MSLLAATRTSAIATVLLVIGAVVTAFYARNAYREQSRQTREVRDQTRLLQEQADRDIRQRRRAQATQVFTWVEMRPYDGNDEDMRSAVYIKERQRAAGLRHRTRARDRGGEGKPPEPAKDLQLVGLRGAREHQGPARRAQHDVLLAAGVDPKNIFLEKISTRITQRPQLEAVRRVLREGDTLVITKVDRLARSLLDLITIADDLRKDGITLEVLSGPFNRDDPMGEAFFQMTGVFAQLERDFIRQRTMDGLQAARARGRNGGRRAKLTDAQAAEVRRLYAAREKTVKEIGELFGITRESVYRYVGKGKGKEVA